MELGPVLMTFINDGIFGPELLDGTLPVWPGPLGPAVLTEGPPGPVFGPGPPGPICGPPRLWSGCFKG
jgi:hypothetical protein